MLRRLGVAVATRDDLLRLTAADLRRHGLAMSRGATLLHLCRSLDLERLRTHDTRVVLARLTRERGIGPWSVGVIALEGLGRYDHGLVGDLGLVKLLSSLRGEWVEAGETAELLAPYEEWQGLAGLFLMLGWSRGLIPGADRDARPPHSAAHEPRRLTTRRRGQRPHRLARVSVNERRIAVLGAGKIGEALIGGLLSSGWRDAGRHRRLEPPRGARAAALRAARHRRDALERRGRRGRGTRRHRRQAAGHRSAARRDRPPDHGRADGPLRRGGDPDRARSNATSRDGVPVCRAMPNTPSIVHEGVAGLCAGAHADDAHVTLAEEALAHLGAVVRVPEKLMDAVTAVSGSGPAYFALLAEAMIEAGILLGLSREVSTQLVVQTMLGTAHQLRDQRMHPVELREMVTSPGGTTIAAIRELEIAGVRAAFLNAIQAAMVRSRELAAGEE